MSEIVLADRQAATAVLQRIADFQAVVREHLKEGHDYGRIPASEKPVLLKPGAEKICMLLGLRSEFDIVEQTRDFDAGFFQYLVKCRLIHDTPDGPRVITEGVGAANTRERRYQRQDAYTLDNTVLKMAKKRALVDAALMVGALSDLFTQDLEDIVETETSTTAEDLTKRLLRQLYAIVDEQKRDRRWVAEVIRQRYHKYKSTDLTADELRDLIAFLDPEEKATA